MNSLTQTQFRYKPKPPEWADPGDPGAPRMPFGGRKGWSIAKLPQHYLDWLLTIDLAGPLKGFILAEVGRRSLRVDQPQSAFEPAQTPRYDDSGLTPRQREVLEFVIEQTTTHSQAPTIQEIAQHLGVTSFATVHKHLTNLQAKGYVDRKWNYSRSTRVLAKPTARAKDKQSDVMISRERRDVFRAIQDLQRASLRLMRYVNRGGSRAQASSCNIGSGYGGC